jgi:hypothetical protein
VPRWGLDEYASHRRMAGVARLMDPLARLALQDDVFSALATHAGRDPVGTRRQPMRRPVGGRSVVLLMRAYARSKAPEQL